MTAREAPRPAALRVFYGGTFDPVHNGHLAIARAARDTLGCAIRLMPAADPPHRPPPGADAVARAAMLDLAVRGEHGLRVDRRELAREGRSYSIDTVRELRREYGADAPLALVLGADSFLGLPTWKDWRTLLDQAHLVIAERPGSPLDDGLPDALDEAARTRWTTDARALHRAGGGSLYRLRQPLTAESATDLRQRIASGAPWRHLLPAAVADYIVGHGLYRASGVHPGSL